MEKPRFFSDQQKFRQWLEKNHQAKKELLVGFYKVDSGKPSMTWPESVDQALCFGWIDGVRRSIDEVSYQIRFTPRKPGSIWSRINLEKVKKLQELGLMTRAGLDAFAHRKEHKTAVYSFENSGQQFTSEFTTLFKKNKAAWKYFEALPAGYRKTSTHWVMSAKQETTRLKRLKELIKYSSEGLNPWRDNKYNKKNK